MISYVYTSLWKKQGKAVAESDCLCSHWHNCFILSFSFVPRGKTSKVHGFKKDFQWHTFCFWEELRNHPRQISYCPFTAFLFLWILACIKPWGWYSRGPMQHLAHQDRQRKCWCWIKRCTCCSKEKTRLKRNKCSLTKVRGLGVVF